MKDFYNLRLGYCLKSILVITILVSGLNRSNLLAQEDDIKFERVSYEEGFNQNTVICILQDIRGFMWFGTTDGLIRYDGYNFRVYKHIPGDTNSLNINYVLSMCEDNTGTLWVGTVAPGVDMSAGGLNRFNRETEKFTLYQHNPDKPNTLSDNTVLCIYEDSAENLWVGTLIGGLNKFDRNTGKFICYKHDPDNPNTLSGDAVSSICEDESGALWIGTDNSGINRLYRENDVFIRYKPNPDDPSNLSDNHDCFLFSDRAGDIWVGTDGELNKYNPHEDKFMQFKTSLDDDSSYWDGITSILEDKSGELWIGANNGLMKFDREKRNITTYKNEPDNINSLSRNYIMSICEDVSGTIWIGTWAGGLNKIDRMRNKFSHYLPEPEDLTIFNNKVNAIYEEGPDALWIGTPNGLYLIDRKKDKRIHFQKEENNPNSLSDNNVYSITKDRTGTLWIGTENGLNKYDADKKLFFSFLHDPDDSSSLSYSTIIAIYEDVSGNLWVGTWGGLNKFNRERGCFTRYNHNPSIPASISSDKITAIFEDSYGNLWISTYGGGLNKYIRSENKFEVYRNDPENPTSINGDWVVSVCEDISGGLWIGTTNGLNRFDRESETFISYDEGDGLPNRVVHYILSDKKGNLWITTSRGLSKFNPNTEIFRNYDARDGFKCIRVWGGPGFESDNGEMFFGGDNGLCFFHPDSIRDNPFIPPIVLTDFQLFNKSVPIGGDSPLKKSITYAKELKLTYNESVFSFEFAALNYTLPEKNQYAYMMEGFDEDWNYIGNRRTATYTNLSAGKYTFRVKGSNNDGIWNEEGTSIDIIITPPPWKTWWAYSIYAILLISASIMTIMVLRRRHKENLAKAEIHAELSAARKLQTSLIPTGSHELGKFQLVGKFIPASAVGGDYFDFRLLDDGRLIVMMGDVSGHGLPAGILVSMAKASMVTMSRRKGSDFSETLGALNEVIRKCSSGKALLMTFCYLVIEPDKGIIGCSANGHPFPLIARKDGSILEIAKIGGYPLGVRDQQDFQIIEAEFLPGETLLLYTDGLPEQVNETGEPWGYDKFQDTFEKLDKSENAETVADGLLSEVLQYAGDAVQADDMTVVVVRYR